MNIPLKSFFRQHFVCLFVLVILAALPTSARADLYDGSLTGGVGGGITANPTGIGWDSADTKIEWKVTGDGVGPWTYWYRFTAPDGSRALSHLIIQVSDGSEGDLGKFLLSEPKDFINTQGYDIDGTEPDDVYLDTYSSANPSNPGMPGSVYGLKFDSSVLPEKDEYGKEIYSWEVEFDSYRNPMWGDFYAKDGTLNNEQVYAYNTSFGIDGDYKIAVPDTSYVPVPGAVLLGMLGLSVAGIKLRKYA